MKLYELTTQYNLWKHKISKAIKILTSSPRSYSIVEHRNGSGKLLYHNAASLVNQGDESILKSYYQGIANSTPSGFKINLATDTTILDTATTYTIVSGTGYATITVAHNNVDWTVSKPVSTWQSLSKDCVFTAGGTWTTARKVVLIATLNGVDTLIGYADMTQARTLVLNDTLTVAIITSFD